MRALPIAAVLAAAAPVHADGVYATESFGVARARGGLEAPVGNALQTRIGVGARVRWAAVEAYVMSNMQTQREGAFKGVVGGQPADGRADMEAYGTSLKVIAPLYVGPNREKLEGYVRGGPSLTAGTGMLDGYRGYGFGGSAGIQLTGRVRALGFLWAPLFFMKRGPKVTGSLFLDQGWDFYKMRKPDAAEISGRVGQVSVGFAVGSSF